MMTRGVRYYSFLGGGGYGEAALAYIEILQAQGVPVWWSPLVSTRWGMAPWHLLPDHLRPQEAEIVDALGKRANVIDCFEKQCEYDTVFIHTVPELWPKLVEEDKFNIGYTVWETDQLPSHWPELLGSVNHICVPCQFNSDLFQLSPGPVVSTVPHAVRRSGKQMSAGEKSGFRRKHGIGQGTYIFYVISTWDPRKAMNEAIDAYLQAFDEDDDVCLLVKTEETGVIDNSGIRKPVSEIIDDTLSASERPAKIVVITGHIADEEMQLIHEVGDCYFSLTHSEGWGLGAFDAASIGNPVIITGWGGQLDYLPGKSSYLVDYELDNLTQTAGWESYESSQKWAFADKQDAVMCLRSCFQNRAAAKSRGQQLQAFINKRFSDDRITEELLEVIDEAHPG